MNFGAWLRAGSLWVGVVGIGCSPQAGTDYRGEPLAVLQGEVITQNSDASGDDLVAAVVWMTTDRQVGGLLAASAPLSGEFPSNFQLELLEPPLRMNLATSSSRARNGLGGDTSVQHPGRARLPLVRDQERGR